MEVAVHHEDFFTQEEFVDGVQQNWWCEATRDLEVVLSVNVTGSSSTGPSHTGSLSGIAARCLQLPRPLTHALLLNHQVMLSQVPRITS